MKREDKEAIQRYRERLKMVRDSGGQIDPHESTADKEKRIRTIKADPEAFANYYFPQYVTSKSAPFQIESAKMTLKNPTIKLFDEWGRGLAKSVWDDVIKPIMLWANGQAHYMVLVTVSKDRASELLEDLRAEFEANPRITNDFGEQVMPGQWEKGFFITKGGFIAKALGAGQSVRGLRVRDQRPDYIVVDDLETKETSVNPMRQKKLAKWIERDLIPTMDGKIRRFIYANNRFAPVMIQTILQERHPNWKVHHVKAYDPVTYEPTWKSKYGPNYYREVEDEIGVLAAMAEYNGEPHVEGEIFTDEQIQWTKLPNLNHMKIIIGRWDVAYAGTSTSDFNAVRVWGLKGTDFFYIDSYVRQSKMKAAIAWMCEFQKSLPNTVVVHWGFESQFWNDEVNRTITETEAEYRLSLNIAHIPTSKVNKYDRIVKLQAYYQNGRIYYNENKKSHADTQTGLAQLFGIEPGYKSHDDAPDADESCISELSKYIYTGSDGSKPAMAKYKRKTRF